MRKLITVLASVAMVVALGAPAFADGAKSHSPSTNQVTTMRVDHHGHGGDWHEGRRGHDGRRGYDGYYRHHGYYDGYYGYPYYYDGYYDGGRCRWAYYHDRYWFDRYCRGYYYGY